MEIFAKSDIGRKRVCNEDSYGYSISSGIGCSLFVVADGMGGAKAGGVASRIAVTAMIEYFEANLKKLSDVNAVCEGLHRAVAHANQLVLETASQSDAYRGMGTTVVCACLVDRHLIILNVGDSRAYLISGKSGTQLTEDHSYVEHLVKTGQIDRAEAKIHPRRNEITRALGAIPDVQADLFLYDYREGNRLVLCTDGLTRMVEDRELFRVARKEGNPERICDKLVDLANRGGGLDNITVVTAIL
ncbi:MAG: Stp1/IreP family PP2C-type Ser/Thr phosphatase [Clostridia bacterium]|nr:Stp1/IreP family PP2C-type Ser/Thr phosphatase [Clostridia bacterium]